jgi:transposase
MDDTIMGVRDARRLGQVEAARRGETTNRKAARVLGISVRQFIRLKQQVGEQGPRGLLHGNLGRPSSKRLDETTRQRVEALLRHEEVRLNDCHVVDLLAGQGVTVSDDSVRRLRIALGLKPVHTRRPSLHHRRRERKEREGDMVLIDGSDHEWLGAQRPRLTLIGTIDDATGHVLALTFRPSEDLHGYAVVLREVLTRFGVPGILYGDRTGIAVRNDEHWTREEELEGRQLPPQFGQMLEELGIRYIAAGSPQAKGRIERLWRTLQDRLLKELALMGVTTMEAAEAYLPGFIARFNKRFGCVPREAKPAWQKPPRDFERMLACRYPRIVRRDNVVTLPDCTLQLPPGPHRRSHQGRQVEVRELLDGRILVSYRGEVLLERPAPQAAFVLVSRSTRSEHRRIARHDEVTRTEQPKKKPGTEKLGQLTRIRKPAKTHAWRRPYNPNLLPERRVARG